MALTNEQLTEEVEFIKKALNNIQVAITNLAAKQQLRQLALLVQADINDIKARVDTLEAEVTTLLEKT